VLLLRLSSTRAVCANCFLSKANKVFGVILHSKLYGYFSVLLLLGLDHDNRFSKGFTKIIKKYDKIVYGGSEAEQSLAQE